MDRHAHIRITKICNMIKDGRYPNCRAMAEEFEVSERTILRDIEALKDSLGAPVRYSKARNGYYFEDNSFSLPDVKLSEGELVAVFLGAEQLKRFKGTPFASNIEQAFKKIELLLPKTVSVDLNEIERCYSFDLKQVKEFGKDGAKIFETLSKAIKEKKTAEMTYYAIGNDKTTKRAVDPYHMRHSGSWYLVGYDHGHKDIRTYAVDQIREINITDKNFTVDKGFSPEKFFAHSWGIVECAELTKVVVKLDKSIARWFKNRKLHSSQQTAAGKDGSLTLTFEVAGTEEIKRWILSQGSCANVLEPKELREEIMEEAYNMCRIIKT